LGGTGAKDLSKAFFFAKKKQKTLAHRPTVYAQLSRSVRGIIRKSFLLLFFKKEGLSFYTAATAPALN
jgi:hypothetical protein